jgi:hypothetical protein
MLSHIPVWVFALPFVLGFLGYRLSRPREVAPMRVLVIAGLLACFSFWGVASAFGAVALPLLSWVIGMVLANTVGAKFIVPRGMALVSGSNKVFVPGSWRPSVLIACIFVIKFSLGFAAGMGAPVAGTSALASTIGLLLGLCSGGFAANALAVMRVSRVGRTGQAA